MNYWLIKSEPETYSIDHLRKDKVTPWEGVRSFAARNWMMKMEKGDLVLFYHSGDDKGVYGIAKVAKGAHPDMSQYKKGHSFEKKATKDKPMWYCVDVAFVEKCKNPVSLAMIKSDPKLEMMLLRTHGRLSVQPVSETHFRHIQGLSQ
jgi:predicted RNA-binding protein with PUA-like domain